MYHNMDYLSIYQEDPALEGIYTVASDHAPWTRHHKRDLAPLHACATYKRCRLCFYPSMSIIQPAPQLTFPVFGH